MEGFLLNSF